jgi:hypothetical protein
MQTNQIVTPMGVVVIVKDQIRGCFVASLARHPTLRVERSSGVWRASCRVGTDPSVRQSVTGTGARDALNKGIMLFW